MRRNNLTPRPVKAAGAKEAHGSILDPSAGALYVHMHRESGLSHRHYVLKAWQVNALRVLLSRPMLLFYVAAIVTWGYMFTQTLRVEMLQRRIGVLTLEAEKIDTLTLQLTEMQDRYRQVQQMLGPRGGAGTKAPAAAPAAASVAVPPSAPPPVTSTPRDTTRSTKTAPATRTTPPDTTVDTTRTKRPAPEAQ